MTKYPHLCKKPHTNTDTRQQCTKSGWDILINRWGAKSHCQEWFILSNVHILEVNKKKQSVEQHKSGSTSYFVLRKRKKGFFLSLFIIKHLTLKVPAADDILTALDKALFSTKKYCNDTFLISPPNMCCGNHQKCLAEALQTSTHNS